MYLDKVNTELVVRVVYAAVGNAGIEQAKLLAEQANSSIAVKPFTMLFGGSVLMRSVSMPALKVRGFALRVDIVGISLARFRAAPDTTKELELSTLLTDGLVFVVEPGERDLRAAFEHARSQPAPEGMRVAVIAPAGFEVATELGVVNLPIASGRRAAMDALQAVIKPLLLDIVKRLGG